MNEVLHRQTAAGESLGDADDEPKVRLDQKLFARTAPLPSVARKSDFLIGIKERDLSDPLEPHANGVVDTDALWLKGTHGLMPFLLGAIIELDGFADPSFRGRMAGCRTETNPVSVRFHHRNALYRP